MKQEIKNRLDTLISIHNRMYEQVISIELDILILQKDKNSNDVTPEQAAYTASLIAKKVESMEAYEDYVRIAGDLIAQEMDKTSISRDN